MGSDSSQSRTKSAFVGTGELPSFNVLAQQQATEVHLSCASTPRSDVSITLELHPQKSTDEQVQPPSEADDNSKCLIEESVDGTNNGNSPGKYEILYFSFHCI